MSILLLLQAQSQTFQTGSPIEYYFDKYGFPLTALGLVLYICYKIFVKLVWPYLTNKIEEVTKILQNQVDKCEEMAEKQLLHFTQTLEEYKEGFNLIKTNFDAICGRIDIMNQDSERKWQAIDKVAVEVEKNTKKVEEVAMELRVNTATINANVVRIVKDKGEE
jgi:hypothetical protein